ncbi:MAG: hypothetical protein KAQ83_02030 [Nanoarchaeota archaeon]|nr:hypothetical protein [Nanoarchaeota archaeon]
MKINKWWARGFTIAYIVFMSLFSLDAESFLGWIMHMIPSFVLIGVLIISWKKQLIGTVAFGVLGIIFTIFFKAYKEIISFLILIVPLFMVSALFYFSKD